MTTEHLAEGITADYDAEGRLVGIEAVSETCTTTPWWEGWESQDWRPRRLRVNKFCDAFMEEVNGRKLS